MKLSELCLSFAIDLYMSSSDALKCIARRFLRVHGASGDFGYIYLVL